MGRRDKRAARFQRPRRFQGGLWLLPHVANMAAPTAGEMLQAVRLGSMTMTIGGLPVTLGEFQRYDAIELEPFRIPVPVAPDR